MSPIRFTALVLCSALASFACNGDDDGGGEDEGSGAGSGGDRAGSGAGRGAGSAAGGGAGSGAGSGTTGGLDPSAVGSELSVAEVEELCGSLDEATGLLGDLELACQVEAWLATFDQQECEAIVGLCNDAGATMLGLELPSLCAEQGEELPDCDVTVAEMLACAEEYAAFWASRTCAMEGLTDMGPGCDADFEARCPSLYGSIGGDGSSSGAGGTGSCGGVGPSCFTQFSSGLCITVDGCVWSSSTESCTGVARSCSSYIDPVSCGGQSGCFWSQ